MTDTLLNATLACALAAGAGSVVALRVAWRGKNTASRLVVAAGWTALLASVYLWSQVFGAEFGTSYALAWFALCAMVAVLRNREYRKPQPDTASALAADLTGAGHKWLTFLAAGPVAMIACIPLTLLATLLLPTARVNQMALAAVLYPTLWALAAYWTSARDNPGRLALLFAGAGIASYLGLRLLDITA